MPLKVRVDSALQILRIEVFGVPDIEEEKGIYRRFRAAAGYRPGMPILVDDRNRSGAAEATEIRDLAQAISDPRVRLEGTRCAVLVGSDAQYGMARMWEARAEGSGLEIRVFRSEDEAIGWLTGADA